MGKSKKRKKSLNKLYIESVRNHYNVSSREESYARNRIDIVTLSLSTGGIVFGVSILKFVFDNEIKSSTCLLKVSLVLFVITILANLFNQHIAVKAHNHEKEWARKEEEIMSYELIEENINNPNPLFNAFIKVLNIATVILLTVALSILALYLLTTF